MIRPPSLLDFFNGFCMDRVEGMMVFQLEVLGDRCGIGETWMDGCGVIPLQSLPG